MKPAALVLLFASLVARAAADDALDPGDAGPHPDIRREILSIYKYEPRAADAAPRAPVVAPTPTLPSLVDLSAPEPAGRHDRRKLNELQAALVEQKADARSAMIASRLGIGVSSVHAGRYFAAGVATVFYIPVAVGIGFAW